VIADRPPTARNAGLDGRRPSLDGAGPHASNVPSPSDTSSAATFPEAGRRADPILAAAGLTKSYGSVVAVQDVSLAVRGGRVVGLLGVNGAGKTTTVRCLAGLLAPDRGDVWIDGRPIGEDPLRAGRTIGIAGDEPALYPELTARRNLRFFGAINGLSPHAADGSIEELCSLLGIGPLLDRRVRHLSQGQRQLVHIAASLVHRPDVLVMDEPTTGLDVTARRRLLDAVRQLSAAGVGVLFSSHQLDEIEQVCDDVVILHGGRVIAVGTLEALLAAHDDTFIEVRTGTARRWLPGTSIQQALATLDDVDGIDAVSVVRPTLESLFLSLTRARPSTSEVAG
jgi:ABC-type multidrug transport system ATPase subunit